MNPDPKGAFGFSKFLLASFNSQINFFSLHSSIKTSTIPNTVQYYTTLEAGGGSGG